MDTLSQLVDIGSKYCMLWTHNIEKENNNLRHSDYEINCNIFKYTIFSNINN